MNPHFETPHGGCWVGGRRRRRLPHRRGFQLSNFLDAYKIAALDAVNRLNELGRDGWCLPKTVAA